MTAAAIYARFSSDLQRDRSIEDQVALCQAHAARLGLAVVATYDDRARSGASLFGRDGLMALMDAAKAGAFKAVIVEALDRLSRDQEDLAGIYKRLSFAGVEILAVHDGRADQVQVGIRGLVGALYLQDLAHKVRRGMAGVVRDGRHAGGKAYGYRPTPGRPGEWEIVAEEAAIVRRIFAEYAAGETPRDIARGLNRDNIPPPRGRAWLASAINGNAARGSGFIHNEIYVGRLVWNRLRMIKDPDTGKRVSRANPESEWQRADAPHLAIIDADLWAAAQRRLAGRKTMPRREARRPRRLLSGLLRCGCCGGGMSIKDSKGRRPRVTCTRAKEGSGCKSTTSYPIEDIERTVLAGLKRNLGSTAAIACYIRAYNAERQRLAADVINRRDRLETALKRVDARMNRLEDQYLDGLMDKARFAEKYAAAKQELAEIKDAIAASAERPNVVTLHPAAVEKYLDDVNNLETVLAADFIHRQDQSAGQAVRALIESVIISQKQPDGSYEIELKGKLASLIGGNPYPQARLKWGGWVVAEEGFEPPTQGL
ncbi:MAG: recombinase family protein [Proteobacteria bacterium]|nr:MAG: recombinase family protein [Pseudomonadota bacterium]